MISVIYNQLVNDVMLRNQLEKVTSLKLSLRS